MSGVNEIDDSVNFKGSSKKRESTRKEKKIQKEIEIIRKAQEGDTSAIEYLILSYMWLVKTISNYYHIAGGENEDLIQEGLIGLYKAINDYDPDKPANFKTYADICIRHEILTAVKTSLRKKHSPLNNYVSLYKPINDETPESSIVDLLEANPMNEPEISFIIREKIKDIDNMVNTFLTELEKNVLFYYLSGLSYGDIAKKINKDIKSVDNAIQRVKRKLEKNLENKYK